MLWDLRGHNPKRLDTGEVVKPKYLHPTALLTDEERKRVFIFEQCEPGHVVDRSQCVRRELQALRYLTTDEEVDEDPFWNQGYHEFF